MTDLSSRERLIQALDEADRVEAAIEVKDREKDRLENDRLTEHLRRAS